MMQHNIIFNECCIDTMKRLPTDSVKLTVTSPPYNMNLRIRKGEYCSRQVTTEFSTKYSEFSDNIPIEQYYEFHKNALHEMMRISNLVFYNIQIVTGSKRAIFKMIGDYYDLLKDIIIWDKGHAQPSMQHGVLNRRSELILIFDKNNAISRQFNLSTFGRGTLDDIWTIKRERTEYSDIHGATFPQELVAKILQNFSDVGDIIYDPFMGTGTTAIVCNKMGRKYIGSELIKEYYDIAIDRIRREESQFIFS